MSLTRRALVTLYRDYKKAKGFHWRHHAGSAFDLYYEPGSTAERDLDKLKDRLENATQRIATLLGVQPSLRFQAYVVENRERMKDLFGRPSNGWALGDSALMIHHPRGSAVSAHEPCHVWSMRAWGRPKGSWINEGLAVYSDDQWHGHPLHHLAKWLADHGKLAPMADLTRKGWHGRYSDMITYPQLGSFTKFVFEKHGRDQVKQLWKKGPGPGLAQLEQEWQAAFAPLDATGINYKL